MNENIKTIWRLAYVKLFSDEVYLTNELTFATPDGHQEWKQLFWRFYWRLS